MANMSDAVGSILISVDTPDKDLFAKAWNIIRTGMAEQGYPTFLDPLETYDIDCEDGKCFASGGFIAFGRWDYESNVRNFGRWLDFVISDDDAKFLEQLTFSLVYEFADYEIGGGVFYKALMENRHEKGQALSAIRGEILSEESLEISEENFFRYEIWDEEDVPDPLILDEDEGKSKRPQEDLGGDDLPEGSVKTERTTRTHDHEF